MRIAAAHAVKQPTASTPLIPEHVCVQVFPAVNASRKHPFAVELQSSGQAASPLAAAGTDGQTPVQSLFMARQPARAVRSAARHTARHCKSPAAQLCAQPMKAVRACIAQTLRPRAQLLTHC
ncbi:MAG TPA: hypothetical protein VMT89_18430 [Candidatus Acidoferrales bacterium]|nr:hypothetical protein [Candidatus Acidoferrales bacterium]